MAQKVVVKLDIHDEKERQKAMKSVSSLSGIESLTIDMKERKLTVVGGVDPVQVVNKLRRWHTELLAVGPAKEPEKKKEGENKDGKEQIAELVKLYKNYNPYYPQCYRVYSVEENPNSCVIS